MSILFVENPLVVNTVLARRIGLNESIVLQQLSYWLRNGKAGVEHEGRKWIYNTYAEWIEQFPFWSESQVKRIFASLRKLGVITVEQLRSSEHIRTNYYTINFGHKLLKGSKTNERTDSSHRTDENVPSMSTKSSDRTGQDRPIDEDKTVPSMGTNSSVLSETTTEITTETSSEITKPLATEAGAADAENTKDVIESEIVDNEKQEIELAAKPRIEIPDDMPGPRDENAKTYRPWANYAFAFRKRYGAWPVWNQRTAAQISQLVDRLGQDEAPAVAAFYLSVSDARLINEQHPVGLLLARAESLRTQWITGRRVNSTMARQQEQTAANYEAAQTAKENILKRGNIRENRFYKH